VTGWSWRKSSHSFSNGNCVEVGSSWRKSSRCDGGSCIEVGHAGPAVAVRDSRDPDGPVLAFGAEAWAAFAAAVKRHA
jgi:Domain of unknown function (DUF397)